MYFFDSIMSPLSKEYCSVYYILGIFLFILGIVYLILSLMYLFNSKTQMYSIVFFSNGITILFTYVLYRIMYSICIKVL